jgi:hypothetical protein
MAAQSVTHLPEGDDWVYELKLDGSPYQVTVISALSVFQRLAQNLIGEASISGFRQLSTRHRFP